MDGCRGRHILAPQRILPRGRAVQPTTDVLVSGRDPWCATTMIPLGGSVRHAYRAEASAYRSSSTWANSSVVVRAYCMA